MRFTHEQAFIPSSPTIIASMPKWLIVRLTGENHRRKNHYEDDGELHVGCSVAFDSEGKLVVI
jgi:hypothetical protein